MANAFPYAPLLDPHNPEIQALIHIYMWLKKRLTRWNNLSKVTQGISCPIQFSLILESSVFLLFRVSPAHSPCWCCFSSFLPLFGSINTGLPFAEWLHLSSSSPPLPFTSTQPLDACLQIQAFQAEAGFYVMECLEGLRTGCRVGPDEQRSLQPYSSKN